jgi:ABC-type branched-subunit amino acid transport system ATPase component
MLLEVDGLTAGYGRAVILHGIGLWVDEGEVVTIIGPNGAGKSTVLRAVSGQLIPRQGKVRFMGRNVTRLSPEAKNAAGLTFIPQGRNVFPGLSVRENLELAGFILKDNGLLKSRINEVYEAFPWIGERRNEPARSLSGGQRQILALSRIILLGPRLVLLDEPSLGLAPLVVEEIFETIRLLNERGVSFLLVEQNARKGLSAAHRGYVLEQGMNRMTGSGCELLDSPEVQRLYLGG